MQEKLWKIVHKLNREIPKEAEAELLSTGLLDSFDMTRLIESIEENFEIDISPEDIIPENFHSQAAILDLIRKSGGAEG